jgi:trimeric autotransporter adhesin
MAQTDGVLIDYVGSTRDNSAVLDVRSANQGLMVPRVALTTGTASAAPVTSPAASLLIYNTATVGDVTPGYYYWNVTGWVRLVASNATPGTVTSITTNNGITGGTITTTGNIGLTGQALAFHNLGSNGLVARTGAGTVAARSLNGTANQITVTNGDGVAGNPTLAFDYSATLAGNPALASNGTVFGSTGVIFEGSTADDFEGLLTAANPTADRTWTLPNASGTIALTNSWSAMSVAEGQTATATTSRFMRADFLKQIIEFHAPNVTLAGENYLSLTGQQITANAVNLASTNVTGILPVANGGTGSSTQGWVDLTTDQTANGIKTWGSQANFSNVLRASNGTAAAPSYSFTNSTGMGMYRSGVNMLSLATGGIERLRMIANGNVGIGAITTPATLVHMGSQADATTASQIMTVESMGFAGVNLIGDRGIPPENRAGRL